MNLLHWLLASFTGTLFMTCFTYGLSELRGKNFKQPVLLDGLLKYADADFSQPVRRFLGWLLHCFAGISFVLVYQMWWKWDANRVSYWSGLVLGALSGVAGIIIWMTLFRSLSKTIAINKKEFYFHLFFAHIVFALGTVLYFKMMLLIYN